MLRTLAIFSLVAASLTLAGSLAAAGDCGASSPAPKAAHSAKDIVDVAAENGSFDTLVRAVEAAGLLETLKGDGPFTVFAPSDAALAQLPDGALDGLLRDKSALAGVLTDHVIPGLVLSSDLPEGETKTVATVNGAPLRVRRDEQGRVFVNGARVTTADVIAAGGVIHLIDRVVLPDADGASTVTD